MKRIRVMVILCTCFVSMAWGQQTPGKCTNNWSEFHRTNMERWNPCEKVLNVNNVAGLGLKWRRKMQVGDSSAVANGVVYVAKPSKIFALNAGTGALLWGYTTGNFLFSSPAVANGVVYVGSSDTNVYALNASTGAKLWSYTTGSYVLSSPAVANGIVYVGSSSKNVYALKAGTGALLWSYTTGGAVGSPAVANGVVYVGTNGGMYAFSLK
jgi:outer membrane protein assembly factor BamB